MMDKIKINYCFTEDWKQIDISNSAVENNLSEHHMSYSNYDWMKGKWYCDNGDKKNIREGHEWI